MKDMPRLQYVLRGIESDEAKPSTPQAAPPSHACTTYEMYCVLQIWATFLVCFFGFMHSGEITIFSQTAYDPTVHLNFADVSVDDPDHPTIVQLSIKQSKTDPFWQGVKIHLGTTGNTLDPIIITALLNYLGVRSRQPMQSPLSL